MIETYWIQFADGHVLEINQTYILRIIFKPCALVIADDTHFIAVLPVIKCSSNNNSAFLVFPVRGPPNIPHPTTPSQSSWPTKRDNIVVNKFIHLLDVTPFFVESDSL